MPLTDYLAVALLDHVYRGVPYAPPAAIYVGLLTARPTVVDPDGTELVGAGYARRLVLWSPAAGNAIKSADVVAQPELPGALGPAVAIGYYDAPAGGHLLGWCATPSTPLAAGQPYYWPAGALVAVF